MASRLDTTNKDVRMLQDGGGKPNTRKSTPKTFHYNLPTYTPPPAPMYRPIYHPSLSHVRTITQIVQNALCIFHWHKQTSLQSSQCLVCP